MNFSVTILGNNSALPAHNRFPTSQVLSLHNQLMLIDCGEGTQMQMNRFKIKRSRIHHIFISHMHGDHYFGLPGLITSYQLQQRKEPLNIYGPEPIKKLIELVLDSSHSVLSFDLNFFELNFNEPEILIDEKSFLVKSFPVKHRIPTCGFLFSEKPGMRKILSNQIEKYQIPVDKIQAIKAGDDFIKPNGEVIENKLLTVDAAQPRHYAFCADTLPNESVIKQVSKVSLLYHESTFMSEMETRALQTFHSTTTQAAQVAKQAGVKKLLIGHFSAKYADLNVLLAEAQQVFPNTAIATEGEIFDVE